MTREGVEEAWVYWLSQHPISVPETIEAAVKTAVNQWLVVNGGETMEKAFQIPAEKEIRVWLMAYSDEIIKAIAKATQRQRPKGPQKSGT